MSLHYEEVRALESGTTPQKKMSGLQKIGVAFGIATLGVALFYECQDRIDTTPPAPVQTVDGMSALSHMAHH